MLTHPEPRERDARRAHANVALLSERELLRRYAVTRDPLIREQLVRRFTPFTRSLALRYRNHSEPLDDLIQVANLGLVKAIDGFDPDRGKPFVAYAAPTILGELRRHFRDHVWTLRLPRGLGELTMKVDEATARLAEELGRYPSAREISERIDVPVEDVLEALEAGQARKTLSLDAPRAGAGEEESAPAVDLVSDTEGGYDRVEAEVASKTAELDEREWQVLRMRFNDNLSQNDIGRELGVSQMQISRISRRALWKLLNAVRGEAEGAERPVPPSSERRGD